MGFRVKGFETDGAPGRLKVMVLMFECTFLSCLRVLGLRAAKV